MQVTKQDVRNRILSSAENEFSEKGFAAASMRTIAKNAGTSPGNLYKYYSGKDELFQAVTMPTADECIGMLERTFDISKKALREGAHFMAGYVSDHNHVFRALALGPGEYYTDFLNRFAGVISRKLKEHATKTAPEACLSISNPSFFESIAQAYVGGLRPIMEKFTECTEAEVYIRELMFFLFSDFSRRITLLNE